MASLERFELPTYGFVVKYGYAPWHILDAIQQLALLTAWWSLGIINELRYY